jgi:hypothetical protein
MQQKAAHKLLSDPSKVWKSTSGKRIQTLSPGKINPNAGPDFLEVALLVDGVLVVGDAEYHQNSSEWNSHGHGSDINYSQVILHIVNDNRTPINGGFETIVLDKNDLLTAYQNDREQTQSDKEKIKIVEDLHRLALQRLLRKSSEAKEKIINDDILGALESQVIEYLEKYKNAQTRPVNSEERLNNIIKNVKNSAAARFLLDINVLDSAMIPDLALKLLKAKIADEGAHLRREILINCIMPLALALAEERSRINIFLWYWSTPALQRYGIINRRFPDMPQNYLWQQQGVLEYIKDYGANKKNISDFSALKNYARKFDFYKEIKA